MVHQRENLIKKSLEIMESIQTPFTTAGSACYSEEKNLVLLLQNGATKIYCFDTGYTYETYEDVSNKSQQELDAILAEDREYNHNSYILEIA